MMLHCRRVVQLPRIVLRSIGTHKSEEPRAVRLQNRSIIRLGGEESRPFLQGLITNDINHLGQVPNSIYSLFLNKSGRVLYDCIIYGKSNDELFLECDSAVAQDLRKHLMIYRIRRKISIDLVNDELSAWAVFNKAPTTFDDQDVLIGTPDPRVKDFGERILTRLNDTDMEKRLDVENIKAYNRYRYKIGIAEGIKEIVPGKAFPLEINCDYMHGLSVHKGCYLGQEFTARTYHTGVVRKRIMPVSLDEAVTNPEDLVNQEVYTSTDKAGGKIKGMDSVFGIGLLRIDLVLGAEKLIVDKKYSVKTWKPSWWPIVAPKGNQDV